MRTTGVDWEQMAIRHQAWRAEIDALKVTVAVAEADVRAEFNLLLAATSTALPGAWDRSHGRYATAEHVDDQLEQWGVKVRELKIAAIQSEALAAETFKTSLRALRVDRAASRAWLQPDQSGHARLAVRVQERAGETGALQARTMAEAKAAYGALLTVLRADGALARERRRTLFGPWAGARSPVMPSCDARSVLGGI